MTFKNLSIQSNFVTLKIIIFTGWRVQKIIQSLNAISETMAI